MIQIIARADDVLRCRTWSTGPNELPRTAVLAILVIVFGSWYGAVMGTFGLFESDRSWQIVFSASKVPLLLFVTLAISLPSVYVLNLLAGVGPDFPEVLRALLSAQAGLAIVLASLAPFTLLWYASSSDYAWAVLFNGAMFAMATASGQWILWSCYRPLVRRNPKHRRLLWTWVFVYSLVGIQAAWMLRPFIGSPTSPVEFVRPGEWTNAYEVVWQLIWRSMNPSSP